MISTRSNLESQTSESSSTNYVVLRTLATASVLAAVLYGTPIAYSEDAQQKRNPTLSVQDVDFSGKTSAANVNISIISEQAACNAVKSVHTPDSSARMPDGGVMQRALSTLEGLKQLENGWAGYDSIKPDLRSIDEAVLFAQKVLSKSSIFEPIISPATDGEVSFFWESSHITLDLGFYGDGSYSFYAKTEDGEEFFGDNYNLEVELPSKIYEHLQKA